MWSGSPAWMICERLWLYLSREAARPQPQGSADATGYWAADSLLPPPLSLFLPFPLHRLCLLVNLMGFTFPLKTCPHILPSAVGWIKFRPSCTVFSHGLMRNIGFLGRWGTYACPQCLPSDIVSIRSWTRTLRRPGIRHRHLPYQALLVRALLSVLPQLCIAPTELNYGPKLN